MLQATIISHILLAQSLLSGGKHHVIALFSYKETSTLTFSAFKMHPTVHQLYWHI